MANHLHSLKLLRFEMAALAKHLKSILIFAMLCLALPLGLLSGQTAPRNGNQESQATMSEAPDPATPFLVGAGLITLSVVIRRRRRLRSKESTTAKVDRREDE